MQPGQLRPPHHHLDPDAGGRYDFLYPVETHQEPLLGLFGTPAADKLLQVYETGHSVWFKNEVRKDELDFLDQYLGPVR